MFWKKKTVYETRPVYSIRQELERLRPEQADHVLQIVRDLTEKG